MISSPRRPHDVERVRGVARRQNGVIPGSPTCIPAPPTRLWCPHSRTPMTRLRCPPDPPAVPPYGVTASNSPVCPLRIQGTFAQRRRWACPLGLTGEWLSVSSAVSGGGVPLWPPQLVPGWYWGFSVYLAFPHPPAHLQVDSGRKH